MDLLFLSVLRDPFYHHPQYHHLSHLDTEAIGCQILVEVILAVALSYFSPFYNLRDAAIY